ncbi:MAG: hypothetical protein ACPGO3_12405 [Magnetospiraceae bacterium]
MTVCRIRFALIFALFFAVALFGRAGAMDAQAFVPGIEDLPLMDGLMADPEAVVIFETTDGRIVETEAHGRPSQERIMEFYGSVLPELGWEGSGRGPYVREGEILTIDFEAGNTTADATVVRFALRPRTGG